MLSFFDTQIQYFHVDKKKSFPMIKRTFKEISFLGILNWITTQTNKYEEIISTPHDRKIIDTTIYFTVSVVNIQN